MNDVTLDSLVQRLSLLEEEVKRLKDKDDKPIPMPNKVDISDPDLFNDQQELISEGLKKVEEGLKALVKAGYIAVTTSMGTFQWNGGIKGWYTASRQDSIENLPDEDIQPTLEPFTNPRRIKVLKTLFNKKLTGSELSQQTGLVGGQLYHHLSILEEAKLIVKDKDTYTLTLKGAKILLMVVTVASDVWVQTITDSE